MSNRKANPSLTIPPATERVLRREVDAVKKRLALVARYAADPPKGNGLVGKVGDLSVAVDELVEAGDTLGDDRHRYRDLFNLAPGGYIVTDVDGRITEANRAAAALLGTSRKTLLGERLLSFVSARSLGEFREWLPELARGKQIEDWEVRFEPRPGDSFIASVSVTGGVDASESPTVLRWILHDITDRKDAEDRMTDLAFHDPLTGLPNRLMFQELFALALARAKREGGGVAVLSIDLDRFKLVNDSLGHAGGDDVLREVSARLEAASRAIDVVTRWGGDEFLLLLADLDPGDQGGEAELLRTPREVVARIEQSLQAPCLVEGVEVHLSASIGIATFPDPVRNGADLLTRADADMYQVKEERPQRSVLLAGPPGRDLMSLVLTIRRQRMSHTHS